MSQTARSAPLTSRRLLIVLGVLLAVVLFVLGSRLIGQLRGPVSVDPAALTQQFQYLKTFDGFVATPLAPSDPSLDATGWGAATFSEADFEVKTPPDPAAVEAMLASDVNNGLWSLFYAQSSLEVSGESLDEALLVSIRDRVTADGYIADDAIGMFDIAAATLTTWAAVSTLTMSGEEPDLPSTIRWASSELSACVGNEFVRFHLYEILVMLEVERTAAFVDMISACESKQALAPTVTTPAANEEQLLHSFAIAGIARAVPSLTEEASLSQLRTVLAPQPYMAADSWWTYYALRGYVAAGGSIEDYRSTVTGLAEGANSAGMLSNTPIPSSSLQQTYFAALMMSAAGVSAASALDLNALAALASQPEADAWYDADWAIWGDTMYLVGAPLTPEQSSYVREASERCASQDTEPANARSVGACRSTASHLGAKLSPAEVDWSLWANSPSVSIIDTSAVLGVAPPSERLEEAVRDLLSELSTAPTSILADVLLIPEANLSNEQKSAVQTEISQRRAASPLGQFYVANRSVNVPDFYSSAKVVLAAAKD